MENTSTQALPSLPQHATAAEREQRQFQLSLARTAYNYMRTYLEPVPLSADLPKGEEFNIAYEAKVVVTFAQLAKNFQQVVVGLLKRELDDDLPDEQFARIKAAYEKLEKDWSIFHPERDLEDLKALLKELSQLPKALENMINIPKDIEKMATGLEKVFGDFLQNGPTAFLKSTMFDMLCTEHGRDYLQAKSQQDYDDLFISLPTPLMLALEKQPWMPDGLKPCETDWFFGYLQIAGFNTTQLRGVKLAQQHDSQAFVLADLQRKMPVTDVMLQSVTGDPAITLAKAAELNRLYAVDYAAFVGAKTNSVHGEQRYLAAPVALFYWNPTPPAGYPPGGGVMQPIAIQLNQQFDAETTPIFTPNDCANANDAKGFKWRVAKYFVNVCSAIQHESIAHLGDCHLTVEPIVVATHRQLAEQHPLFKLLIPHFRFTININDDAIHSLIIPGGVVATNVGPAIESTLALVAAAHEAWRFDDNNPDRIFKLRGVDQLPVFPFRDDTVLLWQAIQKYVGAYLRVYYRNDQDVIEDDELQAWVNELVSPTYAGFKGMNGLKDTGDAKRPAKIDSLDYLIQVVAQIIYIAGPLHASVNYAQYPLMSYMPSVAGTIYAPPPSRSIQLQSADDCLRWYPPLDVSLYTFSFEYLLSGVQYDTFGYYSDNPRMPYFTDKRVEELVANLHDDLALIEIEIRKRNRDRPMEYPFQLPSQIPNSISI